MATKNEVAQAVQGKVLTPSDRIEQLLSRVDIRQKFEAMLGKKASGFISSILSLRNSKPQLKAADPMSIISAAAIAATLDLPINPNLGFAHIVPYGDQAQFQMGYKGFVQLAIRTGVYQTMNVAELFEGELIKYNRITGETTIDESKRISNKVVAYVAYFKLTTGFEKYLLMTTEQVTAHAKRYSKSFNSKGAPWQNDFDAMAKKTVLKLLLSKYGVLSVEMQKAVTYDQGVIVDTIIGGEKVEFPDGKDAIDAEQVNKDDLAGSAQEPV
jgi:recombination protein RecT